MDFNWDELERGYQSARKTPTKAAAPKKKQKSFLEDNISTLGGVGGGIAGGALGGAAAGSVVLPGVGTVVGGLLGAVLGGGLGSAGGQAVENYVVGDDLGTDVVKEGLIGGATSIGPIRALSLAGGATKGAVAAAKGGGKAALIEGLEKGAVATPIRSTLGKIGGAGTPDATGSLLKSSAGGKLIESGNKALASQYGTISKPLARSTNPADTVSELASMGITKPVDAERVAQAITGPDGILNRRVADAVSKAGGVETGTLRQVFNDALDNAGIVDTDRKSLTTLFEAQMKRLTGGSRGSLNPKADPSEALDMMKALEKRIANLTGKGKNNRLSTPEREDQAAVLRLVRDELEDQLYSGAGANTNVAGLMTPEVRDRLINLMPGNATWAKHVDNNIMNAADVKTLRSAQSPFVRIGQIIDEGDTNAFTYSGRANGVTQGGIKNAVIETAQNVVKNPAARAYAAATRALPKAPVAGAGGVSPLGAGARVAVGSPLVNALTNQPQEQPLDNEMVYEGEVINPGGAAAMEEPANPFGVSQAELGQAMMAALQNGDEDAFKQLKTMYDLVGESSSASGKLGSAQATAVAKSDTATSALDRLESLYGEAGGGGRVQGTLAGVLGAVGGNASAKAYNDQLAAVARYMGRAMGETGAGSDADAQAFIARLPKLTDTPEEARIKLTELRAMLRDSRTNLLRYGGGAEESAALAL